MSSKPIHNGQDITKLLKHNGCPIRMGKGSHRVSELPNGQSFTYYEHGEYPKGTLNAFLKILRAAGLILLLVLVYNFF
jgi:predicted RNA binding protein YcfA (HicA-like mRNA interferase family)